MLFPLRAVRKPPAGTALGRYGTPTPIRWILLAVALLNAYQGAWVLFVFALLVTFWATFIPFMAVTPTEVQRILAKNIPLTDVTSVAPDKRRASLVRMGVRDSKTLVTLNGFAPARIPALQELVAAARRHR
jgi:hypothetical protein